MCKLSETQMNQVVKPLEMQPQQLADENKQLHETIDQQKSVIAGLPSNDWVCDVPQNPQYGCMGFVWQKLYYKRRKESWQSPENFSKSIIKCLPEVRIVRLGEQKTCFQKVRLFNFV